MNNFKEYHLKKLTSPTEAKRHLKVAFEEAKRFKSMELERSETQIQMLLETIDAFQKFDLAGVPRENLRKIFLARLASIFDGFSDSEFPSKNKLDDLPPPAR